MKKWFKKFDPAILIFISILPPFFYGYGFAITGDQIFSLQSSYEKNVLIAEKTSSDGEIKPVNAIEREVEKLEKENSDKKKTDKRVKANVQSLRDRVKVYGNVGSGEIKKEGVEIDTAALLASIQKPDNTPPKVIVVSKPQPKKEEPVVEPVNKSQDPWDNFVLEKDLEKEGNDYREDLINTPVQNAEIGKGTFNESRLYKAQFVQNKTYDLSTRNMNWLIQNIEPMVLKDGTVIPKNSVFTGSVRVQSSAIKIKVTRIKLRDREVPANIIVTDASGNEGLARQNMNEAMKQADDQLNDILDNVSDGVGLRTPFGGITIPTRIRNGKEEIFISSSIEFYLKII